VVLACCSKPVERRRRLAAVWLPLPVALAATGTAPAGPGAPDLTVAYISLAPRYPAFEVEYPEGLPQVMDPDSGRPLDAEEARRVQRWPRSGESITATARVLNRGSAPTGPFRYTWVVNRKRLPEGRHPGLAAAAAPGPAAEWKLAGATVREASLPAGTYADLELALPWKRNHTIRLEVRLESGAPEEPVAEPGENGPPRDNNIREERLDALAVLVAVPRTAYAEWGRVRGPWNSRSFEDWAQHQLELLRARMQGSVYPEAPRGAEQPVRIDLIRVLEDGEDPAALRAVAARNGWDGVWWYDPGRSPGVDARADGLGPDPRWFRQALDWLGVANLEGLAVLPEENRARLDDTGGLAPGFVPGAAGEAGADSLPEHTVVALNRMLGRRRGHVGSYLFDLPRQLRLRVLDGNGRPVPEAEVLLFQKDETGIPPAPLAQGSTAATGELPLPRRRTPTLETADGFTLRDNPFGPLRSTGVNGLLLLQVRARGVTEHLWLPVTTLNLAQWRELGREVTIDVRTRIPGATAPLPPARLTARVAVQNGVPGVELAWDAAPAPPAAYALYRARYPTHQFERIASVTLLHQRYFDPYRDSRPVRYAVAPIDLRGEEGAPRTVVVKPPPPAPPG
jgi:hypothetical protein